MQNYISFVETYPLVVAPILGIVPALLWLWFWLKEDVHPEPLKMITLSFLGGMVAVVLVLPFQQLVLKIYNQQLIQVSIIKLFRFEKFFIRS